MIAFFVFTIQAAAQENTKDSESMYWVKITEVEKKLGDRTIPAKERKKLFSNIAQMYEKYLDDYKGQNKENTNKAALVLCAYLPYLKKAGKLHDFTNTWLKNDVFTNYSKSIFYQSRAQYFFAQKKYPEALNEADSGLKLIPSASDDKFQFSKVMLLSTKTKCFVMQNKNEAAINKLKAEVKTVAVSIKDTYLKPKADSVYKRLEQFILLLPGKTPPAFTLIDETGSKFNLSDYKGKVVLCHFWISSCPLCMKAMKEHISAFYEKYSRDTFEVVSIGLGSETTNETFDKQKAFMKTNGFSWKYLFDAKGTLKETYKITSMPFCFLVNKEGKIVVSGTIPLVKEQVEEYLKNHCSTEEPKVKPKNKPIEEDF